MRKLKSTLQYPCIMLLAVLSSFNYAIFIFPNNFAPAGVDGICTMIQDLIQVSMGYLSLAVNIPLLIAAFLFLGREFAVKTTVYVLSFSLATIWLRELDISAFAYHTDNSIALAPVAAGAIRGLLYAVTLKLRASSGGTDIIAAIVKRFRPQYNLMNVIFAINMAIALCSYFVYGFKPEPVICSIIYALITSTISNRIRASKHEMVKYEIITPDGSELCTQIFEKLHRTATKMDARGAYSGADKEMLVCVIERQKAHEMEKLVQQAPDTVYFVSAVNDTME